MRGRTKRLRRVAVSWGEGADCKLHLARGTTVRFVSAALVMLVVGALAVAGILWLRSQESSSPGIVPGGPASPVQPP